MLGLRLESLIRILLRASTLYPAEMIIVFPVSTSLIKSQHPILSLPPFFTNPLHAPDKNSKIPIPIAFPIAYSPPNVSSINFNFPKKFPFFLFFILNFPIVEVSALDSFFIRQNILEILHHVTPFLPSIFLTPPYNISFSGLWKPKL